MMASNRCPSETYLRIPSKGHLVRAVPPNDKRYRDCCVGVRHERNREFLGAPACGSPTSPTPKVPFQRGTSVSTASPACAEIPEKDCGQQKIRGWPKGLAKGVGHGQVWISGHGQKWSPMSTSLTPGGTWNINVDIQISIACLYFSYDSYYSTTWRSDRFLTFGPWDHPLLCMRAKRACRTSVSKVPNKFSHVLYLVLCLKPCKLLCCLCANV